ncbi:hypothetical protein [Marinitoga aeolica]|uniref:Uncharacterized protein n=1 Tax=Marinitoga aeolica TaxID=2809031 RepID=A0ABY8PTE1_9BACT|nr:hypothetical protein [Marinitoga aeolica]WGS65913.1 hypothetical protein JRV97_05015 [Marinitoga aeolica]
MYLPNGIFGYGSNTFNYWIKLYSTSNITPIKINRWNEFSSILKNRNYAEIIIEDIWNNTKKYKFILVNTNEL